MIAVMGASGNTGGRISEQLLRHGERIRALGCSSQRLAALERRGADVRTGDATDAAFLTKAFVTRMPSTRSCRRIRNRRTSARHGTRRARRL